MKVKSTKPRGQRIFKCVKWNHNSSGKEVYVKRPFWVEPVGSNWWFRLSTGQWEQNPESYAGTTTSYYSMTSSGYNNVYSLKAVKRLIHKWNVPKGTKFKASLPFAGHTFIITK